MSLEKVRFTVRREPRHRVSLLVNDWDRVEAVLEAARKVLDDPRLAVVKDGKPGQVPAGYSDLYAALAVLDGA